MRFVIRWAFRFLILVVVLGVALVLLKDTLLKSLAEQRLRREIGLEVRIGKLEAGLFTPTVHLERLVIYNTAEFGGGLFIDLPEVHLEYDRLALASRKLHLTLVRLNLAEANIVKNQAGRTNLEGLEARQKEKPAPGAGSPGFEFTGIDLLNLSIGKLRFTNLQQPSQTREVNIQLQNEMLRNVTAAGDLSGLLVKLVLQKALKSGSGENRTPSPLAPRPNPTPEKGTRIPMPAVPSPQRSP